jgi:hypothetical protein
VLRPPKQPGTEVSVRGAEGNKLPLRSCDAPATRTEGVQAQRKDMQKVRQRRLSRETATCSGIGGNRQRNQSPWRGRPYTSRR